MALPKLNDVPKYSVTIPSNQMEIQYRPFLVKEEKILLIAIESGDPKQMDLFDTFEYQDMLEASKSYPTLKKQLDKLQTIWYTIRDEAKEKTATE